METIDEKKIQKLHNQNEDEDINFLESHSKLLIRNKGNIKSKLVRNKLEVMNNLGDKFDKYEDQLHLTKKGESINENKLEELTKGDSDKKNENL